MAIQPIEQQRASTEGPAVPVGATASSAGSLAFVQDMLDGFHPREFAVRCWDGAVWEAEPGCPTRFTLVLAHPGALRALFLHPSQAAVTEAFLNQECDVEGDLEAATTLGRFLTSRRWTLRQLLRYGRWLHRLRSTAVHEQAYRAAALQGSRHSRRRDRHAVSYHYDVSNEFYALWLDSRMVYSCAYFERPDDDLEAAQERKLDYVCRKLRLKPGERLLDIGCGWGGLILHAAEHYGVRAVGITLSRRQAEFASKRILTRGLAERCRVELRDYRDLPRDWAFDKVASIGMVEHVGFRNIPAYFAAAWDALRPGGVFLNHGIACRADQEGEMGEFMDRYVFPDSQLIPLDATVREAERAGFEVRDVECLREHYMLTLRHWVKRLEARHKEAADLVGEKAYRVWRLYMATCAHGFRTGRFELYQTLLSKPSAGESRLPLTRHDWYHRSLSEAAF